MFISLGGGLVLRDSEIIAIIDKSAISSEENLVLLERLRREERMIDKHCRRVSSYVLAKIDGQEQLYTSPHNAEQLLSET